MKLRRLELFPTIGIACAILSGAWYRKDTAARKDAIAKSVHFG